MSDQNDKARARLTQLVDPAHTALLTMEVQVGVVGDGALLPALVDQCREQGMLPRLGALCSAARAAGVRVVHNTVENRPDGAGFIANCKIFALSEKQTAATGVRQMTIGSPTAALVPELDVQPEDIVVGRLHGMTPFTSTALDQILRNLGVTTVIATGVSVNLGVTGMVLGALDRGYQVVLPRDCVAGVPDEYAQAVIDNSLSLVSTITTAQDVMSAWA